MPEAKTSSHQRRNKKSDRDSADGIKTASAEKQDIQLFLVTSLNVTDGTLRYRDLTNGGELTATQINLKVNDFEWTSLLTFSWRLRSCPTNTT